MINGIKRLIAMEQNMITKNDRVGWSKPTTRGRKEGRLKLSSHRCKLHNRRQRKRCRQSSVLKRNSFLIRGPLPSDGEKVPSKRQSNAGCDHVETKLDQRKVFGIYGVKEVLSVIRLFKGMDHDGSGQLTLAELMACASFFETLGFPDMTTVFQAMDQDGSGTVTLKELLHTCFHYATKAQVDEMLQLAKMGTIQSYLQSKRAPHTVPKGKGTSEGVVDTSSSSSGPTAEERAELLAIFQVFDLDGDGTVSVDELMEALRVDDDEVMARGMAKDETRHNPADRTSGLTKSDITALYDQFDANGNKVLDLNEFVALMHSLYGGGKTMGVGTST
jgi:Ca2+-binding EF-hand superfamily protein